MEEQRKRKSYLRRVLSQSQFPQQVAEDMQNLWHQNNNKQAFLQNSLERVKSRGDSSLHSSEQKVTQQFFPAQIQRMGTGLDISSLSSKINLSTSIPKKPNTISAIFQQTIKSTNLEQPYISQNSPLRYISTKTLNQNGDILNSKLSMMTTPLSKNVIHQLPPINYTNYSGISQPQIQAPSKIVQVSSNFHNFQRVIKSPFSQKQKTNQDIPFRSTSMKQISLSQYASLHDLSQSSYSNNIKRQQTVIMKSNNDFSPELDDDKKPSKYYSSMRHIEIPNDHRLLSHQESNKIILPIDTSQAYLPNSVVTQIKNTKMHENSLSASLMQLPDTSSNIIYHSKKIILTQKKLQQLENYNKNEYIILLFD